MEENMKAESKNTVRVAVLEDHLSTVDGYTYRFSQSPGIELVASASYGEDLLPMLAANPVDVLILDASVPVSEGEQSPYPLFNVLPQIRKLYPKLAILVISGHKQPTFIRSVMDEGVQGYIVKSDAAATKRLAEIVASLPGGGVFLSQQSVLALSERGGAEADFEMPTQRQREVLSLFAAYPNWTTEQAALRLKIAHATVRTQLSLTYKRLRVNNLTAAVMKARELGLITPMEEPYKA